MPLFFYAGTNNTFRVRADVAKVVELRIAGQTTLTWDTLGIISQSSFAHYAIVADPDGIAGVDLDGVSGNDTIALYVDGNLLTPDAGQDLTNYATNVTADNFGDGSALDTGPAGPFSNAGGVADELWIFQGEALTAAQIDALITDNTVPLDDGDVDGLKDAVDLLPATPMSCSICTNSGFSDANSGGITSGEVITKDPGVVLTIQDEAPNPAKGIRVIATGAGQTEIELPSGGFEVNGTLLSGATYTFSAPANFVLTKTNSALLEVDQGTVQVAFEALDTVATVAEGESIEVSETSVTEIVVTAVEGEPVVELEGVEATVSLGTDGSIEILQESPDDPVVLTAVAGTPTVTVDGEEITLEPGESVVTNVPPSVAADNATVTINEGQSAANSGTFSDQSDDIVTVSASIGTVTQIGTESGTWSWEFDSTDGPDDGQTVIITATDDDGDFSTTSFLLVVDNVAPDVAADNATVTINEEQTAANSGSFSDPGDDVVTVSASVGTVSQVGTQSGSWFWEFDSTDGPEDGQTVVVTATDSDSDDNTTSFVLVVNNVAPDVAADNTTVTINEGQTAANFGSFSDPGDDVVTVSASVGTVSQVGTQSGTWSWEFDSTDGPEDGQTVVVTATDSDGDDNTTSFVLVVDNVAPDVVLDISLAVDLTGGQAFLGRKGVEQSHTASATDPGDDDLTFDWSFGALTTYPADGSPPSEATDTATVTFSAPGVYTVEVVVTDDGDSDSESLTKLVVDDCDCTKSQGFWKHEFKTRKEKDLKKVEKGKLISEEILESYLDIIRFSSSHFGGVDAAVPLDSFEDASLILNGSKGNTGSGNGSSNGSNQALDTGSNNKKKKKKKGDSGSGSGAGSKTKDDDSSDNNGSNANDDSDDSATKIAKTREKAVRQTLAAWLNFAKGAVELDEDIVVEPGESGSGTGANAPTPPVTKTFEEIIVEIEAILNNPDATKAELERAKDLAEAINLHDKDNPDCTDSGSGSGSNS